MTGGSERSLNELQQNARDQLRAAVISEQRASLVAAVVPIVLWVWVLRDPVLPLFTVLILLATAVRARALPAIDRGEVERAVVLFMAGKWAISIAFAFVLPIALPIVVVNLIMPIALGSTNLTGKRFVPMIVAAVAVAFVVAVFGYTTNVLELEQEVSPWVWQWMCAIILTIHFIPLSIILWRSNQQQALTFAEVLESNARLRASDADLRSSRRRLVGAADAERSRIERDLHDGAQQRLVAVLVQLRLANRLSAAADSGVDPSGADALAGELEAAINDLRDLAHGIYPPLLTASGLERALNSVARRSPVEVSVSAADLPRTEPDIEAAIYFCCLEALQNAVKHGGADVCVAITLVDDGATMRGSVVDDGPGFDQAAGVAGRGLRNMADRVGAAGGELSITSTPVTGTAVQFDVRHEPVDQHPTRVGQTDPAEVAS